MKKLPEMSMRGAWWSLLVAASLFSSVLAADETTYTPPADEKGDWSFTADPSLPNVLILGDSISIGYTRPVREKLKGKANVYRPMLGPKRPDNCGDTVKGLQKIDAWLGDRKWDVIHFNWGLWDLCYRNPESKNQGHRDRVNGTLSVSPEDYEKNLEKLIARMKATGATLVWASTTVVPEGEDGRFAGDELKYNAVAAKVMERNGVMTDDLFALTKGFSGKYSLGPGDVHYTPEGYDLLAVGVRDAIGKALDSRQAAK